MGRDKGVVYNIVDSVKGGSGKTTFAITLSIILNRYLNEPGINKETSSCLIDMDIQGSALLYLLYGKAFLDRPEKEKDFKFLNDRVIAVGEDEETAKKFIYPFCFENSSKNYFDVIFCDPRTERKKKFRSMSNQNYSPEVLYSTFRMGLANMLSSMRRQNPYNYSEIIFDMPPNADGYSDAVYDIMLKKDYSVLGEEDVCNLFLLHTLDMGQIQATLDYFSELASSENFHKFNKIFFVFNDWCGYKKKAGQEDKGLFKEAVLHERDQIRNKLGMANSSTLLKKIYFVGLQFNEKYYRMCTQTDGIMNGQLVNGMLNPVKYIANMFENMENDPSGDSVQEKTKRLKEILGMDK